MPDYVTRVREGAFYGWPWYYIGDQRGPAPHGRAARSRGQGHGAGRAAPAAFGLAAASPSTTATQFPAEYRGDAFVALHGSWNRAKRTGYKVVRILLKDGMPTGEYEDFLTGFVVDDRRVWGRPVGVAVAQDGALLVSDDGNGTIWRVSYRGR